MKKLTALFTILFASTLSAQYDAESTRNTSIAAIALVRIGIICDLEYKSIKSPKEFVNSIIEKASPAQLDLTTCDVINIKRFCKEQISTMDLVNLKLAIADYLMGIKEQEFTLAETDKLLVAKKTIIEIDESCQF